MAKINIQRTNEYNNRMRDYQIYIDNKKVGTIENGGNKDFEIYTSYLTNSIIEKKTVYKSGYIYAYNTINKRKLREGQITTENIFFNFIKKDGDEYVFLSTPMMEIQRVPKEKFDFAKEQGIIEYIENLPRNIFQVIEAEYQHQSKKIGRDSK